MLKARAASGTSANNIIETIKLNCYAKLIDASVKTANEVSIFQKAAFNFYAFFAWN